MPDAERLRAEAGRLLTQHDRWAKGKLAGAPVPAAVEELLGKAAALCREALAIDPADAHVRYSLGYAYVLSKRGNTAGAEAAFRAAIAADPQCADAHHNLGAVLAKSAIDRVRQSAELQNGYARLAALARMNEDLAGAARSFAAALKVDPSHEQAKEMMETALRTMAPEATRLVRQQARAHVQVGGSLYGNGDPAGAIRSFETALVYDPSHTDAKELLLFVTEMRDDWEADCERREQAAGEAPLSFVDWKKELAETKEAELRYHWEAECERCEQDGVAPLIFEDWKEQCGAWDESSEEEEEEEG